MKKVLLVNSVQSLLEKERSILDRATIQLFTATSGAEALALHRRELVDLVVAELEMPEMTGDVLCRELRRDQDLKQVSVILICFDTKAARERVDRSGANDWAAKPVKAQELLAKTEQLLAVEARKAFRGLISTTIQSRLDQQKFYSAAQNISTSGLLIETDKLLAKGDKISCSFFIPGYAEQIIAEGVVVRTIRIRSGVYHYGLHFTNLKREHKSAIDKFVTAGR